MKYSSHLRFASLALSLCLLFACGDDPTPDPGTTPGTDTDSDPTEESTVPELTQRLNRFVVESMQNYYLWNKELPTDIDITKEADSKALFERMRYTEDAWSMLSDQAAETTGSVTNQGETFGYSLAFGQFTSGSLFAVVLFTYPNSPAEAAGLKRGDILTQVNGVDITTSNYSLLYYGKPHITVQKGTLSGSTITTSSQKIILRPQEMYQDPVVKDSVYTIGGHTIGYLCYTDYVLQSIPRLQEVMAKFQQQQVTDIVLDLRFNPGGEVTTMVELCSMLAPQSAVQAGDILMSKAYNDVYGAYLEQNNYDFNHYLDRSVAINLNGLPLYVLTEQMTASASESTILCLKAHMPVVQIGTATGGKFCGGNMIQPAVQQNGQTVVDPELSNWILYLIMFKYTDKNGNAVSPTGLTPDIAATYPDLPDMAYPLGDTKDPFLSKAITAITGENPAPTATTKTIGPSYIMRYDLRSRNNAFEGLLIDSTIVVP